MRGADATDGLAERCRGARASAPTHVDVVVVRRWPGRATRCSSASSEERRDRPRLARRRCSASTRRPSREGARRELGLRTVGDLLRHYPRRYVDRGELTDLARPAATASTSRWSAEVARGTPPTATREPAGTALPRSTVTDGRGTLDLTFFAKQPGHGRRGRPRAAGPASALFIGKVGIFQRQLPARPTRRSTLFGVDDGRRRRGAPASTTRNALIPIYPRPAAVESWTIQREPSASSSTCSTTVPDPLPETVRARTACVAARRRRSGWSTGRRTERRRRARRERLRFDEALRAAACWPSAGPRWQPCSATPRPRGRDGPAGRVRRAAAVRADRGPARRSARRSRDLAPRPPDAPAAPGRGRLRQDRRRAAGDARGGRRRRPGRAARADRGARPAAPPVDHRDARRPRAGGHARRRRRRHPGRAAHRVADHRRAPRGAARRRQRRGRHRHRHPRAARGHGRVRRPRPRRRRRAAPVRRRAARRADRQGAVARRTCW